VNKRKKVWIDRFQTYLSLRIVFYFVCYQAAVWSLVGIERCLNETLGSVFGNQLAAFFFITVAMAVVLLGVLFIRDAILMAHRIVGPIYRFRTAMKAITAGEEVPMIALRKGDFLHELKDEFNEMLQVLAERGAVKVKDGQRPLEPQGCLAEAK
jgi:hypothetical protein